MRIRAGSSDVCSSDLVFAMSTRAVRDGDDWVITGTKQWITNSPYADLAMVFAVTDPERVRARRGGVTGFVVDTAASGFSVPGIIRVMGHKGGDTGCVTQIGTARCRERGCQYVERLG